ncbi:MAG: DUF624 domain-containing protein [Rhodoglobus sp.]
MKTLTWIVGLTVHLVIACLPTVLLSVFLQPAPSLAWLIAVGMVPIGPALCAAVYAARSRITDPDLTVARSFWRGYRINWVDALKLWVPTILVVSVIGFVVTEGGNAGLPALYRGALLGFAALLIVGTLHALALAATFRFSFAELLQLAAYSLAKRWGVSLGLLGLVCAAVVVAGYVSDLALAALSGLWVWVYSRLLVRPLDDIRERFTPTETHASNPT